MNTPRSFALRLTLMVAYVTGVAVLVVSVAHAALEFQRVRRHALDFVGAQARVIAANSTAALDFDDPDAAAATLGGLAAVPDFAAAEIGRAGPEGDRVFATYRRAGGGPLPPLDRAVAPSIDGRWLVYPHAIYRAGERVGRLTLLYDFAPLRRRLMADMAIAAGIAIGALALSFFAARQIRSSLLKPVWELTHAAESIATSGNYAIRARKVSEDELGALTDVFNGMVERIGEAEAIRRNHRQMLEHEVAQRTAEVLDTQARLRQSERMAALGTLSAGLGHDIGNVLMPLRAHLASIRDMLGPGAAENPDFQAVARATEYLQNLSASLRMLAREPERAELTREPTSLPGWWAELEPVLRAMLGRGVDLEHDIPADLPRVALAKGLLMQAVFNLVQNAGEAMAPAGEPPAAGARIRVRARVERGDGQPPRVALSVEDNGPGMSEEVRRRCVEPYFTTKTRRVSSGLGLSLVKGIVEGAGGELIIESAPGRGCTFSLMLPVAVEPRPGSRAAAVVTIHEPRRRALVSHILASLNFELLTAYDPKGTRRAPAELWVTDSLSDVPQSWDGRVIVLAESSAPPDAGNRVTVLDPATPLSALRSVFRKLVPGV